MPNRSADLTGMFSALADPTRRAVLAALSRGPRATSQLSRPFSMALPSFTQHLAVLEGAGLVRSRKVGRVRTYELVPRRLQTAEHWLARQRNAWEQRLHQLDDYLMELKKERT